MANLIRLSERKNLPIFEYVLKYSGGRGACNLAHIECDGLFFCIDAETIKELGGLLKKGVRPKRGGGHGPPPGPPLDPPLNIDLDISRILVMFREQAKI